ncbi:GNAT family N-acetyltransferase [Blastococcus goldschmidtiae]|uniref:GNAT family N-acetyltransferase n=1 Tax=Blastococcus goldschmidtiae TaxID=3075546 RepID=A0ABU2KBV8_9ACTN|nr:GNAT family N-acetyltransferase [Blastococcus sp. DSM 46792]MDT0277668.1 GNAT family N-acetyltransferase [Blastococcus sp. DSM 46792]
MALGYMVRPVRGDEWRAVKALRLEALSDEAAPMAFLQTHEVAAAWPDGFWRDRVRSSSVEAGEGARARQFVAVADDGSWVGSALALVEQPGDVAFEGAVTDRPGGHVVAVYVAPAHRGAGVLAQLLDAAAGWFRERGLPRAHLFVHVDNARARRAYEKSGFRATGTRITTVAGNELELERELSGEG